MKSTDIIIAQATPPGTSAIAILRLSGEGCISITDKFFTRSLTRANSHQAIYGHLYNREELLDECLITVFKGPKSYTAEDTVEISCHGSTQITKSIMELFLGNGARMANPGEFTLRSFMNGKMDLSQAEAVADLINADNSWTQKVALEQLKGGFSSRLKEMRARLVSLASLLELELDFGEEDVEFANREELAKSTSQLKAEVSKMAESYKLGNALKTGISTVIAGKPNAGKSTILNALLEDDRAIVSAIPGTTRDTIEEILIIGGIKFLIVDTAGLRSTGNEIELIGISKTKEKVANAELLLYVIDAAAATAEVMQEIEENIPAGKQAFLIINKSDLNPDLSPGDFAIDGLLREDDILVVSALNKTNIDYLKEKMAKLVDLNKISDSTVITSERHYEALIKAQRALEAVGEGILQKRTSDLLAIDLKTTLHHIGMITGEIHSDELLDSIFSEFCIGK